LTKLFLKCKFSLDFMLEISEKRLSILELEGRYIIGGVEEINIFQGYDLIALIARSQDNGFLVYDSLRFCEER
jgi:hypothetical protein